MGRPVAILLLLALLPGPAGAEEGAVTGDRWSFPEATLGTLLDAVRERAGVNMVVDWAAIERVGVGPETPTGVELAGVSPRVVLNLALLLANTGAQLPPGDALGWTLVDGVVVVSTRGSLEESSMEVVVYSIRDLLVDVPHFDDAPVFDLTEILPGGQDG